MVVEAMTLEHRICNEITLYFHVYYKCSFVQLKLLSRGSSTNNTTIPSCICLSVLRHTNI